MTSNFAKVEGDIVSNVIVADANFVTTLKDKSSWIACSNDQSDKGLFAYVGGKYDSTTKEFFPPQQFKSWTFDRNSWEWIPPIPYLSGLPVGTIAIWDETKINWAEKSL
jgi:hypothetical protein